MLRCLVRRIHLSGDVGYVRLRSSWTFSRGGIRTDAQSCTVSQCRCNICRLMSSGPMKQPEPAKAARALQTCLLCQPFSALSCLVHFQDHSGFIDRDELASIMYKAPDAKGSPVATIEPDRRAQVSPSLSQDQTLDCSCRSLQLATVVMCFCMHPKLNALHPDCGRATILAAWHKLDKPASSEDLSSLVMLCDAPLRAFLYC